MNGSRVALRLGGAVLAVGIIVGLVSCAAVIQVLVAGNSATGSNGAFYVEVAVGGDPLAPRHVLGGEIGLPAFAGFGTAIAVTGEHIAIGCPKRSATGGAAFLYPRPVTTAAMSIELTPPDVDGDDEFGCSVAMDEGSLVVGARFGGPAMEGAAYVYTGLWTAGGSADAVKLEANDPAAGSEFGRSVAVDGDIVVVGAPAIRDTGGTIQRAGAAYVFERTGDAWSQIAKLVALNPSAQAEFGRAVTVSGNTILVSAPYGDDDTHSPKGAVYVFTGSGGKWTSAGQQRIHPPSPSYVYSEFGAGIDLDGDTLVVGAPRWNSQRGCGYVFTRTAGVWSNGRQVLPSDTGDIQSFGSTVAVHGNRAIFGAPADGERFYRAGAAYLFTGAGDVWTERDKLAPDADPQPVMFGWTVALHGDTVVASGGTTTGNAYVFREVSAKPLLLGRDPVSANEYLAFRTDPKADGPGSGRITVPRELRAPFRIELTAGVLDGDRDDDLTGGTFGFGVEVPGADPRDFLALRARFVEGGIDLTVVTPSGSSGSPVPLPGAERLELAVEHDGTELILSVRPRGAASFAVIGRAAPPDEGPLYPFVHLDGIPLGTEVGFDDPKLVKNAPLEKPGGVPGISELIHEAILLQLEAKTALESHTGEPYTPLDDSLEKLELALVFAGDLLSEAEVKQLKKVVRRARKRIKKAGNKIRNALKRIQKGKRASKISKLIEKAMQGEVKALAALL